MTTECINKSILDNTHELKSFISDLRSWEKDAKLEDDKYEKMSMPELDESLPPLRNSPAIQSKSIITHSDRKKILKDEKIRHPCEPKSYADWDKFDVDKALQSDSDEELQCVEKLNMDSTDSKKPTCKIRQSSDDVNNDPCAAKIKRADRLKEEGNSCYSRGEYSEAVAKYTRAMPLNPTNPILPANRAMSYIKMGEFAAAELDCNRCLKLDPVYIKALLRRATARHNLNDPERAVQDYQKVLELEPWNKDAQIELEKLHNVILIKKEKDELCVKNSRSNDNNSQVLEKSSVKISEVDLKNGKNSIDPNIVIPIHKPQHLRSTKLLVKVPVIQVDTEEKIKNLMNNNNTSNNEILFKKALQDTAMSCNVSVKKHSEDTEIVKNQIDDTKLGKEQIEDTKMVKKQIEDTKIDRVIESPVDVSISNVPPVPNTSHRFSLDWDKVEKFPSVALEYIVAIPSHLFRNYELDIDLICKIFTLLNRDGVSRRDAGLCFINLSKTREFDLSLNFMDHQQKRTLSNLVLKIQDTSIENCDLKKFLILDE